MVNRQELRKSALLAGFKLKQQPDGRMDLNPYVHRFAQKLIEALPMPGWKDPTTNNGDLRHDTERRLGWNAAVSRCKELHNAAVESLSNNASFKE